MNLCTDAQTLERVSERFTVAAFDMNNKDSFLKTLCSLSNQIAGWATETSDPALSKMLRVEFGVLFDIYKKLQLEKHHSPLAECILPVMASLERILQRQTGFKNGSNVVFLDVPGLVSLS